MGEIETKRSAAKNNRFKKRSTRVDLTPMVDLGFLLITFFVFTTTMSELKAMNVMVPKESDTENDPICESCVLTVLLDENNRIHFYEGDGANEPQVKKTGYAAEEIRKVLMQKKAAVKKLRGTDQFILIIKPSAGSNFKNFVDIIDEAAICDLKRYYIDELTAADKELLRENNLRKQARRTKEEK